MLRIGIDVLRIGIDVLRIGIDVLRIGIDVLRIGIDVLRIGIDVLRIGIDVLRIGIDVLRIGIDVLRIGIDVLRIGIDVLRIGIDVLRIGIDVLRIGIDVLRIGIDVLRIGIDVLRIGIDVLRIGIDVLRIGIDVLRIGIDVLRIGIDVLRIGIDVLRIGIDVLRIGIDVLRIGIDVLRIGIDVLRIGIDVLRIGIDVLRIGIDVLRIGIDVPCPVRRGRLARLGGMVTLAGEGSGEASRRAHDDDGGGVGGAGAQRARFLALGAPLRRVPAMRRVTTWAALAALGLGLLAAAPPAAHARPRPEDRVGAGRRPRGAGRRPAHEDPQAGAGPGGAPRELRQGQDGHPVGPGGRDHRRGARRRAPDHLHGDGAGRGRPRRPLADLVRGQPGQSARSWRRQVLTQVANGLVARLAQIVRTRQRQGRLRSRRGRAPASGPGADRTRRSAVAALGRARHALRPDAGGAVRRGRPRARDGARGSPDTARTSREAAAAERDSLLAFLRGPVERHFALRGAGHLPEARQHDLGRGGAGRHQAARRGAPARRSSSRAAEPGEDDLRELIFEIARLLLHHTNFEGDYIYPELTHDEWRELMKETVGEGTRPRAGGPGGAPDDRDAPGRVVAGARPAAPGPAARAGVPRVGKFLKTPNGPRHTEGPRRTLSSPDGH